MKKMLLVLTALLLTALTGYSDVVWSNDFEQDTVGANPTGTTVLVPTAITADNYIKVINDGPLGTDQSMAINYQSGTSISMEFATGSSVQSALQISFSFSQANYVNISKYLVLSAGQYDGAKVLSNNSTSRHSELRFNSRSSFGGYFNAVTTPTQAITPGTAYDVDWFLNDRETQISYTMNDTSYDLAANSVALWLDGVLITSGSLDSQTVGTEGNLGRIGFHTSGEGPDFLFDDFIVQTIVPEPATMGLLLIGMTAVMSVRRYGRIM